MGVSDHHYIQMTGLQMLHKLLGLGAPTNTVCVGSFDKRNVEIQCLAPKIEAIPIESATLRCENWREGLLAGRNIETAMSSPFARNYGAPEMVVKFEIKEGSIHVEQDGIQLRPVDTFHRSA